MHTRVAELSSGLDQFVATFNRQDVFTASISDEAGESELYVNGDYAVSFEMSNDRGIRSWSRGLYRMSFVSKQAMGGNSGIILRNNFV